VKKELVAWECLYCGRRHLWKWDKHDASEGEHIGMVCEYFCGGDTFGVLRRIGQGAWALTDRSKVRERMT
jgi:hypothetical protein